MLQEAYLIGIYPDLSGARGQPTFKSRFLPQASTY